MFDATLIAGAQTSLGKFEDSNEGGFSNAGLTGSEWIVLEYFRDRYSLEGSSLDLQDAAFDIVMKNPTTYNLLINVDSYPELAISVQKRNQFAAKLHSELMAISLPSDIAHLQDISIAKSRLNESLNIRLRFLNNDFIKRFPSAATANIMLENNPEFRSSCLKI